MRRPYAILGDIESEVRYAAYKPDGACGGELRDQYDPAAVSDVSDVSRRHNHGHQCSHPDFGGLIFHRLDLYGHREAGGSAEEGGEADREW